LAAENRRTFRILAVDHEEEMLTFYRDVLCFESEEPSELEALFGDDVRLPSREEVEAEAGKPVFEVVPCMSADKAWREAGRAMKAETPFSVALIEMHLEGRATAKGTADQPLAGLRLAERLRSLDPDMEIVLLSSRVDVPLKEINKRVKGSEKFWVRAGAEAILQIRAAYLSQDGRDRDFWDHRPPGRAAGSGLLGRRRRAA